jgi:excisionase family DNA binding protein
MIDPARERLLTVQEAAHMLSCHGDTVRAMMARGNLEYLKRGRYYYTSVEAIGRALGQGRPKPVEDEWARDFLRGEGVI